jgi:hypothetical protein
MSHRIMYKKASINPSMRFASLWEFNFCASSTSGILIQWARLRPRCSRPAALLLSHSLLPWPVSAGNGWALSSHGVSTPMLGRNGDPKPPSACATIFGELDVSTQGSRDVHDLPDCLSGSKRLQRRTCDLLSRSGCLAMTL